MLAAYISLPGTCFPFMNIQKIMTQYVYSALSPRVVIFVKNEDEINVSHLMKIKLNEKLKH